MKTFQTIFRTLLAFCFLAGMLVGTAAFAKKEEPKEEKDKKLAKSDGTSGIRGYQPDEYQILNINNLWSWSRRNGNSNHSPEADNGVYYPRGTSYVIYEDGFMWGAEAYLDAAHTQPAPYSQTIRVGGSSYSGNTGTRAGWIDGFGATAVAAGQENPRARIYRIRRDFQAMTDDEYRRDTAESNEIAASSVTDAQMQLVRERYKSDWENWPVDLGAPYIERNGQEGYQPPPAGFAVNDLVAMQYDEPGIAGADPNSPADQVIWTVYNDLNRAQAGQFGSEPFGFEVQMTLWGYNRTDALGNMYFKKWRLINKGGVDIDESGTKGALYFDKMYVWQWSDPDLGQAGDDLVGCDTTLSMGFVYNGNAVDLNFRAFNIPVPAGGYDFLQGPIVPSPGDRAVFDLKYKDGYRNLGMSGFSYFSAGSPYTDPNGGYQENTIEWYKMARGYAPIAGPDVFYNHPPGVTPGPYPLSGDPVSGTGFIDGLGTNYSFPPGDRRLLNITGPFTLAPGDTQEVVVALVVGLGADRLSSVSVMKFNDRFAQNTYDALFQVPSAPAAPKVTVQELDREIILDWGDPAGVAETEEKVNEPGTFRFEGYNVYQLPTPTSSLSDGRRIATFDVINEHTVVLDEQFDLESGQILRKAVQFGTNSGIERLFKFDRDFINDISTLFNGTQYYLVVTAYSVAEQAGFLPASLESPIARLTVQPKRPFGVAFSVSISDTVAAASHVSGASDGNVYPVVVNPSQLTGNTYRVSFTDVDADGVTEWNLQNTNTGTMLVTGGTNQSGDANYVHVEGFQPRIVGAPLEFKRFLTIANANGPISGEVGAAADFQDFPSLQPDASQQVGAGLWMIAVAAPYASYEDFLNRTSNGGTRWGAVIPYDYEIRFTATGGYGWCAFSTGKIVPVPFELWRIGINTPDDASDDLRMIPWIFDEDGNDAFNLQAMDSPVSGGSNDPYTDWIYWTMPDDETPGDAGYQAWEAAVLALPNLLDDGNPAVSEGLSHDVNMRRMVLMNWNGGDVTATPPVFNQDMPETGTIFRILTTKPNTTGDAFEFTTEAPTRNNELALASADNIGVFPNPYYAFNSLETNRLSPFVTFNNLPERATVRIFNLAGQLVRKIEKNDDSQFLRWDMQNFSKLPVASGMYIAHVELPDVGVNKVLKLAIIIEDQVLDVY